MRRSVAPLPTVQELRLRVGHPMKPSSFARGSDLRVATDRPTILQIIPQLDTGGAELSAVEIAEAVVRAGGRALVLAEPGGRLAADMTAAGGEIDRRSRPPPRTRCACWPTPARIARHRRRRGRRSGACPQPRAGLERADGRAARGRAVRDHLSRRLRRDQRAQAALQQRDGAGRRGDRQLALHRRPDRASATARRASASRSSIAASTSRAFDPAADRARAGRGPARALGRRAGSARHPAGGAADGLEGPGRADRGRGHGCRRQGRLGTPCVVLAGDAQGRDGYVAGVAGADRPAWACETHVRLVGHVEDMPAAFLAAHVTVVASTEPEAFGRAAHRGGGDGLPGDRHRHRRPAGDRAGGSRPLAAARPSPGWLVPPGDAAALAERLAEALALAPPSARPWLGQRARPHVLANFTVEAMQRSTLAVYDRLLGTVLERRFDERPRPTELPAATAATTLTCGTISPDFTHVSRRLAGLPRTAGARHRSCSNNRRRLQHTSSNDEPRLSASHPVRG